MRNTTSYTIAASLLDELAEVSRRAGRGSDYERRLTDLRQTHRRKTAFIERLDRACRR